MILLANIKKHASKYVASFSVVFLALLVLIWLWPFSSNQLPNYIIWGNGRIDGDEVIVATKFAGRLESLRINEGDWVKKGEEIAQIDAAAVTEQLAAAQSQLQQIKDERDATEADLQSAKDEAEFSQKEFLRTQQLIAQNAVSLQAHDRNVLLNRVADQKIIANTAKLSAITAQYAATLAKVHELQYNLNDMTILAPIDGRVLYKLSEQGEVLANGGRIAVLINPNALYMTVYIPEQQVGQIKIGDSARIFVDAIPKRIFNAHVSFISDKAEFTPKEVQTPEERQRLVFRVKLRVDVNKDEVLKSGMPGDGFIKTDPAAAWPEDLRR